jgi:serpin B
MNESPHNTVDPETMTALVHSIDAFAWDLYHCVRERQPGANLFFSPYSIAAALAMTYAGARGRTATEMAQVLHLSQPEAQVHAGHAALRRALPIAETAEAQRFALHVANALWGDRRLQPTPGFQARLARAYAAQLHRVDFQRATEAARRTINQWVSDETEAKITELLAEGQVGPNTALVLTNALYFNAAWQSAFEPNLTEDAPFTLLDNTEIPVPTMAWNLPQRVPYVRLGEVQAVELSYQGPAALLLLLPDRGAFPAVEATLSPERLDALTAELTPRRLRLSLPRFRTESRLALQETLQALGMTLAFDLGQADFSGITVEEQLAISAVIHQAVVDVDEEGTEAAAATAVTMYKTSFRREAALTLQVDRPFFYAIRHRGTGALLFLGRLLDPS